MPAVGDRYESGPTYEVMWVVSHTQRIKLRNTTNGRQHWTSPKTLATTYRKVAPNAS